ncbi:GlcNAc-PI de-N-acetylase [Streptomyces minutiscleroticus]|uniref:GlcNAc-PI de-N-acetylase n=1 Tax=Streptomyces minutiscleroticus TaxID=68238 RepID=A0A918KE37_9ACTN|nr:PIG-L family deacetylase [Streptomyces minutiscleroticus]GGX58628.1 GlcNAc-PI de-N-acetylase [Streptomyces minutiscleroticus]
MSAPGTGTAIGPRTAVAVSPHLDDAVFSAGGVLALLARAGWRVRVVTCFTATVEDPGPFALSTQLDKGLPADADYMALRRAEDAAAQRRLGTLPPVHLPLPEAPHRGYGSPRELFTPPRPGDTAGTELARLLRPHLAPADLVLAPQAIGDHVDHLLTARAVAAAAPRARIAWWRDVPYVARALRSAGGPERAGPEGAVETTVDIGAVLPDKAAAARCYTTQLGFQFGGPGRTGEVLSAVARSEALRTGAPCAHAEVLRTGRTAGRALESLRDRRPAGRHSGRTSRRAAPSG